MNQKPVLQLKHEGYTGLIGAKEAIGKQLRKMSVPGIPIKYRVHASANSSAIEFIANGIRATLHIENMLPAQKGGKP